MHVLLATSWLDPVVNLIVRVLAAINSVVHNRGWSMVIFALGLKVLFSGLNTKQFKSMVAMQKLAPRLKALQTKYGKSDPQKLQQETMALYKESGVNPLAGCWPMLVQYPVLISVLWAVNLHKNLYQNEHWLWIGSALSAHPVRFLHIDLIAPNLATGDLLLVLLYTISMYFFARYATMPAADPQQAQTQRMMAIMSPLMIAFFGVWYSWPSALYIYWLFFNVFTIAQQFYLLRRYHMPLSAIDSEHAITDIPDEPKPAALKPSENGAASANGAAKRSAKRKKGSKR